MKWITRLGTLETNCGFVAFPGLRFYDEVTGNRRNIAKEFLEAGVAVVNVNPHAHREAK